MLLPIAVLVVPLCGEAQQAATLPRVGFLFPASLSDPRIPPFPRAFRQGLHELGYVEGQNIAIEFRWAEGQYDRLPGLAAELVRLKVNVIVAAGLPATQAAKQATETIPIIMMNVGDPVASGIVASLARPGGNITGMSFMMPELVGKQLEMLKEVVPKVSRVGVLWNPANPVFQAVQLREAKAAAQVLGVRLQILEARGPDEFDRAFSAMTRGSTGALAVLGDPVFFLHRARIADLAAKNRLPAMYGLREHVEAGGLMVYAASLAELSRRASTYVGKILQGAKPGDLPVEQATKFDLVINLKTAKALGLTIPPSLLQRADQVID